MLELNVKVININLPVKHPILSKCRPLYEYSWFIQKIKEYRMIGLELDEAITKAITDCGKEGIMVDFLRENSSEAVNMLFTQFNMEDAQKVWYKEGVQEGEERINRLNRILAEQGRVEDIAKVICDEEYRKKLMKELQL